MKTFTTSQTIVKKELPAGTEHLLSKEALDFLTQLHLNFNNSRLELLKKRLDLQEQINKGYTPGLMTETKDVRESKWKVAAPPADLTNRKVEITGSVDRKKIIRGLNSGAQVFIADFEDGHSPSWSNCLNGQQYLFEAVRKTLTDTTAQGEFTLNETIATLMVRPRGWHLSENNISLGDEPFSASLFDFGLYFYHNATALIENGSGAYFYLPKIETYEEARLWNEVFNFSEDYFSLPKGSIRATVLIETATAAFQLEEILFELKDHSAGLSCSRWEYVYSLIKRFGLRKNMLTPNIDMFTLETPCIDAYLKRVIDACHKRGTHAIGGIATHIPDKSKAPEITSTFPEQAEKDKTYEANLGFDGSRVSHPRMVQKTLMLFNNVFSGDNQIEKRIENLPGVCQLLEVPKGLISEKNIRKNIHVSMLYLAAWLSGNGTVNIKNIMQDVATAELSRSQIWQWLNAGALMDDGRTFDMKLYQEIVREELIKLQVDNSLNTEWKPFVSQAANVFKTVIQRRKFTDFMTIEAARYLH